MDYNKNLIQIAKVLRKNQTPQERKLWYEFLSGYPVRFQRQKTIGDYIVDFYCAKARLVVELDGCGHYEEKQMNYDKIRTIALEQRGLQVLRFINLDITDNFEGVCTIIDRTVMSRISLPQSPSGDSSLF
ncbi:MAG: endonuclease domain-containing protein [Burkholderiales bacterium]